MSRTASYHIVVFRTGSRYVAAAPSFPDLIATAPGARVAYSRLKLAIKARVLQLLTSGKPVPQESVVQTRTLRLDLWYLRQQEELQ